MTKKIDNPDQENYNLAALLRFLNTTIYHRHKAQPEQPSPEDTLAAAFALHDALLFGVDLHKLISKPGIDEKRNSQSHPVANIAIAKLNGELTHAQAVEEIMNSEGVQPKEAEKILSKATKGKQPSLDYFKATFKQEGWGDYKVMPEPTLDEKVHAIATNNSLKRTEAIQEIMELTGLAWPEAQQRYALEKKLT